MNEKKNMRNKKIGVLMGGKSSEREISLKSGKAILESLIRQGFNATGIDVDKNLMDSLKKEAIEVAFIALHGKWGEDGTVQGLLEICHIPYTGSGVLGSALAMDKAMMKHILSSAGIPTPPYKIFKGNENVKFPLPFVIKPANEGSTIGISIVKKRQQIKEAISHAYRYDRKVIVEKYIKGQEITVGIIDDMMLPVVEVRPKKGFYDFESKYTPGMTEYLVPAKITRSTEKKAYKIARKVYDLFELSGCARIDMLIEDDIPHVIDINTSPGMTETSLVPKAWGYLGKTFD
ncbi:MAG TPA: D-alanine--D-alanine ligase, partial [Syntrophorhabdaceae bacterium]|nr:D-alanine--D-alanine ligase [Syntrophorhabdaceae bacterium]